MKKKYKVLSSYIIALLLLTSSANSQDEYIIEDNLLYSNDLITQVNFLFSNEKNNDNASLSPVYKASKGKSVNDEWIRKVVLGDINNKSERDNGYADFSTQSTNIIIGEKQEIVIHPGWTGTIYQESYCVWIDYNQDGDFEDANEQVVAVNKSKENFIKENFVVPATAKTGATRMRVSMKYTGLPSSDENFDFGEVEDYTVVITSQDLLGVKNPASEIISIYPNPSSNFINVNTNDSNIIVEIFSNSGVLLINSNENKIDISDLSKGVYTVKVILGENILYQKLTKI